ncbi:MAG TPA: phosphatidate cytidylyltransferase [Acidimicrobiales bacterium]|nr:phosphatidate cytidylyltransferase [Acidimicrobiales bacterium]
MSDWDDRRQERPPDPTEGVRLLGADEVAEVMQRDDIRHRFSEDRPRFGDRPAAPPAGGPRPALRFPLGSYDDPNAIERPPVVPVDGPTEVPELSHWAGSAAEDVPHMSGRGPGRGDDTWSRPGPDPSWPGSHGVPPPDPGGWEGERGGPPAGRGWGDARGADDRTGQGGPGTAGPPAGSPPGRSVFDPPARPTRAAAYPEDAYGDEYDPAYDDGYEDAYEDAYEEPAAPGPPPAAGTARRRPVPSADRDMRTAVLVGGGFLAVALGLFAVLGPLGGMVVAVPVLAYAAYELFVALNTAGFEAPMPVGVAATAGAAVAAYNVGEEALPLVLVLAVAASFLWYLVGAGGDRPVANIGVTLLGVGWVGLFGSFAGLLLAAPGGDGVAFLLVALLPTIGYDIGGLFVGRSAGSRPLSTASPNKTVEGLAGGMLVAVVTAVVFAVVGVHPFDDWHEGLAVGVVVALVAPLGDLAESLVKRDLGIKDMGSVLPGHGGLLDRFDALLFVLPAVWYLARLSDFFLG